MAMFHLLKIRTGMNIFKNEKCKVTFGLENISLLSNMSYMLISACFRYICRLFTRGINGVVVGVYYIFNVTFNVQLQRTEKLPRI